MIVRPAPPTSEPADFQALRPDEIAEAVVQLTPFVRRTPSVPWPGTDLDGLIEGGTRVTAKLELLQRTGSFKARGALLNVFALDESERRRGVIAVSAGNHAVAVAWAASIVGVDAKLVMIGTANPRRVELARHFGASVVMATDPAHAFELAERLRGDEGRTMVHPYEGRLTALGTATVGAEMTDDIADLDAVIVPIGGGGLIAGIGAAVKLARPQCRVFGVEPFGADSMSRSFEAGEPRAIERVDTIADSLGAPYALPFSYECARRNVDGIVRVSDDELRDAVRVTMLDAKLAVEPAGAAALAALVGPLRHELGGCHVGLVVCGSNIDVATYTTLLLA